MNEIADQTRRLEPALRYLSCHQDAKVKTVAVKFKVNPAALWAWLGAFNQSRPHPPVHIIENCLRDSAPIAGVMPAESKQGVPHRISIAGGRREKADLVDENRLQTIGGPTTSGSEWLAGQGVKPVEVVSSYIVLVTPALAAVWLRLNTGNRKPSRAKIRRFAALIPAGRWVVNGETVKFSVSGRLIDGQSRLRAIIEAGQPALLEIRFGIPDQAQSTMDCGESRRATHTLEMLGHQHPHVLSPALRFVFKYETGSLGSGSGKGKISIMENLAIPSLLKRHAGLEKSVQWAIDQGQRLRKLMPWSEGAFFHYVFGLRSHMARDSFFEGLRNHSVASQPVALLRQRILGAQVGRLSPGVRIKLVVKAWNAHAQRRQLKELVLAPRESCSEIYGVDFAKAA